MKNFHPNIVFDKPLCTLLYIGSSNVMECNIEGGLGFANLGELVKNINVKINPLKVRFMESLYHTAILK